MGSNCCYQCPNRKVGCHSTCEKYLAFVKKNEEIKAKERKENLFKAYTYDMKCEKMKELRRKGVMR